MSSTTNLKYAVYYSFETPEKLIKNEESLVMPTLNMIGSIGGTVGIFIEFDFFNTILKMINLGKIVLHKMMTKYTDSVFRALPKTFLSNNPKTRYLGCCIMSTYSLLPIYIFHIVSIISFISFSIKGQRSLGLDHH